MTGNDTQKTDGSDKPAILFLDIDEVLCFTRVKTALPGEEIDPVSAGMIVRICRETGARIVVTSTWRTSPERCRTMFDRFGLTSHLWSPIVLHGEIGFADSPDDWRVEAQNDSRSDAIDAWLIAHDVGVWAIVDDSFQDFDADKLGRLVHTDMMFGIGLSEYGRAMRLLGRGDLAPGLEGKTYQHPRHTIANLARKAIAAIEQGDEDAALSLLATIRDQPLAQ